MTLTDRLLFGLNSCSGSSPAHFWALFGGPDPGGFGVLGMSSVTSSGIEADRIPVVIFDFSPIYKGSEARPFKPLFETFFRTPKP